MVEKILLSALRAVAAYVFLFVLARIMGRKMISQMTFFDFAIAVTVGSLTANMAMGPENSTLSAATVLAVMTALVILIDYGHVKSFIFRKLVKSEPVVVIENGKIKDENMRKVRLTLDQLKMQLRKKNIFNISDVEFALFETDGKLSVLPKSQKQPVTPSDLNLPTSYKGLEKDIVIDGEVMYENLKDANLHEQWLINELKNRGIEDVGSVFYAGLDTSGNLYVSIKEKQREESHGQHGIE